MNALFRRRAPIEGLDQRLIDQRDLIRGVLGQQWVGAVLLSAGRLLFDYGCLDACVRATGAHPRPSLVLLAYAVAGLIGLVPVTPGGLGVVEAGLTGMLVLVGMDASTAFLATLAYRLCSYWIPMLLGPGAYLWFRLRFRREGRPGAGLVSQSAAAGVTSASASRCASSAMRSVARRRIMATTSGWDCGSHPSSSSVSPARHARPRAFRPRPVRRR